ncbi:hypothetical protein DNK47_02355, partial [Mycoplasma wenyonii]
LDKEYSSVNIACSPSIGISTKPYLLPNHPPTPPLPYKKIKRLLKKIYIDKKLKNRHFYKLN